VEAAWHRYCLKWDDKPSSVITKFHRRLFRDVVFCSGWIFNSLLEQPAESLIYAELRKLHMIKLSYCFDAVTLGRVVDDVMVKYS
jgi:hypothetical protein